MSDSTDLSTQQSVKPSASVPLKPARGVEHAGVIDAMIHDPATDEVVLIMVEPRPWDESESRLFQLQEKVNAYLSFALDGEMSEAYPALEGKSLRLQLDCATFPDAMTVSFLKLVREQISFQGIDLQVRVSEEPGAESCGSGCGCG
ncbi:MAG: hypothetical protein JWL59_2873 [Chthoniobacteraceae bacterium]|nr:hypothetical protein [Chthoniobacteraceae bacterium]